jgi:hypothetical protein
MDYMSMVMMFYFSNQERLIHIRSWVENCLEVCLMEDHKEEEDHLTRTYLKDYRLI